MIGEEGNILAIGRSGTGKTTCALLRLFATEILFKLKNTYASKGILKNTQFAAEDLDARCGLHTIFVTASPVLTNEVRRYYEKLNEKIKQELIKRDKKREEAKKGKEQESVIEVISTSEVEEKKEDVKPLMRMEEIKEIEEGMELMDEGELDKQLSLAHTLNSVPDESFPLFLTIRRLLLMIDGTLKKPFFSRNETGEIIGLEGNAEWHNESRGVMMINYTHKFDEEELSLGSKFEAEDPYKLLDNLDNDEDEDINDDIEEEVEKKNEIKRKTKLKKKLQKSNYLGREIDFEMFCNKFWPTIKRSVQALTPAQALRINPASVWREINTNIKGSADAHEFGAHHSPFYRYQELINNKTVFSHEDQKKIFEIFYCYERWAYDNNYYDSSDIVNHILSMVKWNGYHGPPIHFIMCDEVQDLPPATLLLLLKITDQNLFFSGDTAQTIAQGISFRFADLKSLCYNVNLASGMPSIMQLTVNFRSHARILDLANSVIRILELYFPNSIDKLRKERSDIDGLMPIILDSEMQNSLFNLLLGTQQKPANNQPNLLARPPLEFGCDQVIIVRNQQAKANLPSFLKHALCLTIFEAKGLEFDDVFLYNFFTDSEVPEGWKLLRTLEIENVKVPLKLPEGEFKQTFDQLTVHTMLLPEEYKNLKEGEYTTVKSVNTKSSPDLTENRYAALMVELKHLYTAITRPRKRLIIFDENPEIRKPIMEYWMALGYVQIITKDQLELISQEGSKLNESSKTFVESLAGKNTSITGWRSQGIRMFRRRYYEQAAKCFEHSGDIQLKNRAEAYYNASLGSDLSSEIENLKSTIGFEGVSKEEIIKTQERISELTIKANDCFQKAAEDFLGLKLVQQAGQCYFSMLNYKKAAECFEEVSLYGQAGEAYYKMGEYLKAGELYEKGNVPSNAILAYEKLGNYEMVLQCIQKFKNSLAPDHRAKLIRKYIQLALNALFEEMEAAQNEKSEKLEMSAIPEKWENQLESENSVSEKKEEKKDIIIPDNKSEVSSGNPFEEVNVSKESSGNPFEEVNASKEDSKSEFSLVETTSAIAKKGAGVIDKDHIAGLDPEDEWIQCETGSIIDSVVSGKITTSNKSSDYAMLDNAQAFAINCSIVKTRRDIFVEDQIMTKIIRYISFFSEDVSAFLDSLRSKSVLLRNIGKEAPLTQSVAEYIVDLDQIDINFVNLLLDVLENLGLYKLCIIICNRYQINERLGRYIVSIGHRYSNIKLICDAYSKYSNLEANTFREMQLKNSIIANAAVHGVFEVVNPVYLKLKRYLELVDVTNSLGVYCYRSMIILGYWKKLVYIMDCENSLALTSSFADFHNYKILFLMNFGNLSKANASLVQESIQKCGFDWLPFKNPNSKLEEQAAMIALDSVIWDLNYMHKFTYLHPKSNQFIPIKSSPEFLSLYPCNKAFWQFVFLPTEANFTMFEDTIKAACNEFLNLDKGQKPIVGKDVFVWDFCNALMQLIFGAKSNVGVEDLLKRISSEVYIQLMQCLYKIINIIHFGKANRNYADIYFTIYLGTLSSFGIRRFEGRDTRIGYSRGYIIHRDSCYFTKAAQFARDKQTEKRKALEERVAQSIPRNLYQEKVEFEEIMKEQLTAAMEKEHNSNNIATFNVV